MTISQALSNAASGLTAAGQRASVTSNNIANALTEGYARRDVELAERVTGGVGAGVTVAGVSRSQNPAVTYERRLADTDFARDDAIASALSQAARLVGASDSPDSLFQKYAAFEQSMRALADTPDSGAAQSAVVNTAKNLTEGFARIAEGYQTVRARADAEIASSVATVNENLNAIVELNKAIGRSGESGIDISALLDQRALLVDQINEQIPVREIQRGAGQIDLITPEGVFLIAGSDAREIGFTQSPAMTAQSQYNNGAGALSGLTVDGLDITPGGSGTQALRGGALAGQFAVRDQVVPEAALALDSLALDLAERFSDPALDSTLPPGTPGLFTDSGALATSTDLTGLAGRLGVNAAVDPVVGGNTARLRDGLGATTPGPASNDSFIRSLISAVTNPRATNPALGANRDLTAAEASAQLTSMINGSRNDAESRANISSSLSQSLRDAELQETGVDTDQELQKLLLIEQAYGANARVIETVDRLLQRLLEI